MRSAVFLSALVGLVSAQGLDIIKALNGTACVNAATSLGDKCGAVKVPGLEGLAMLGGMKGMSRRDDGPGSDDASVFTRGFNATALEKVCSADCQSAITATGTECTNWIKSLPGGNALADKFDLSQIFKTINDFKGLLCIKDSAGNFCNVQLAKLDSKVYKVMIASVIGAINGNTTIDASLTASLDAVCTECTSKLIAAWQGLGNNKDGDMDVGLQRLALACSKNPSTGAYCVPEIAQFSSTLVNAGSATAAVAAARSTVCNNPSPCIGKAASVLRSVSVKNVKTQILLQVLASADLCSVNGNQTCLDSFAAVADSSAACLQTLSNSGSSKLTCSTLSMDCKDTLKLLANAGCCAAPIARALGGSFVPKVLPCGVSISNAVCPPPAAKGGNVTFTFTVPNLDLTKLNKDLLQNVTNAIAQDIAENFQIPAVMITVRDVKPAANGKGTTFVIIVAFPSTASRDSAKKNTGAAGGIPLTNTANAVSSQNVFTTSTPGITANFDGATDVPPGTGSGSTRVVAGFMVIAAFGALALNL